MKKRIITLISLFSLTILGAVGCGDKTATVTALKVEDGIITWDEVKNANSYEVDIGNGGKTVYETSYDLTETIESAGEYTVKVRCFTTDGKVQEVGQAEVKTAELNEPAVNVQKINKKIYFVWNQADNVKEYSYDAHDGNGYQVAKADENGLFKVPVTDFKEQLITVVAKGTSKDGLLYLPAETMYTYKDGNIFDMAMLSKYPLVYTAEGEIEEFLKVGSTLQKGVYDMKISLYVMDGNGNKVSGNGIWGRRLVSTDGTLHWFCDKELDEWEGSGNTIPDPNEIFTTDIRLLVDRGGNIVVPFCDFLKGEKAVIASITYNGKDVISADGGKERPVEEVAKLDLNTLKDYVALYTSPGGWYAENPHEDYEIKIPTKMKDGVASVKITYQVCQADGSMIEGNGMWGRRIAGADPMSGPWEWLNEYDAGPDFKAVELPKPTETRSTKLGVKVENGYFTITAMDFNAGEILIIKDVEEAKTPEGNGIFVSNGEITQQFKVKTTLTGKPRHTNITLDVTYKAYDAFGETLTGNGIWGRRLDGTEGLIWICEDAVDGYPEAKGTIVDANKTTTKKFRFSEINKYGVLTFNVYDFNTGEIIEITSIKYNGKEVLAKK